MDILLSLSTTPFASRKSTSDHAQSLLGLFVPAPLLVGNKLIGVSSNLRHLCSAVIPGRCDYFRYDWKKAGTWNLIFLTGNLIGSFLASHRGSAHDIAFSPQTKLALARLGIHDFSGVTPHEIFNWHALLTLRGDSAETARPRRTILARRHNLRLRVGLDRSMPRPALRPHRQWSFRYDCNRAQRSARHLALRPTPPQTSALIELRARCMPDVLAHERNTPALLRQRLLQLLIRRLQFFRMYSRLSHHRHEIRITHPPRQHM
jgi:hypothetical protein